MLNINAIESPAEFLYLPQTTSTMDVAAEQLVNGVPDFTTIFAEEQTLGRGRRGKYWNHFKGCNLAYTIIVNGAVEPQIPFVTALALRNALQPFIQDTITLKWPNDLKLRSRKLAGILIEQKPKGVLIGVGVNILQPDTAELPADYQGISLTAGKAITPPITREAVMSTILTEFKTALITFQQKGWLPFAREYAKHCETIGQNITWKDGGKVLTGIAVSLTQHGAGAGSLELKTADGTMHTITAGEIIAQAR